MLGNNYKIEMASRDDLEKIVSLHLASFTADEHVPVLIGEHYVKSNYKWLLSHKNAFILIARDRERIIGLQSVSLRSFELPMFIACFPLLVYSMLKKPQLIINRKLWKRLLRVTHKLKSGKKKFKGNIAHFIIGIVDAEYRGKGIFSAIVNAAVQKCREYNCKAIYTGIYKKNIKTREIFIKFGWKECPELETYETCYYSVDLTAPPEPDMLTIRGNDKILYEIPAGK